MCDSEGLHSLVSLDYVHHAWVGRRRSLKELPLGSRQSLRSLGVKGLAAHPTSSQSCALAINEYCLNYFYPGIQQVAYLTCWPHRPIARLGQQGHIAAALTPAEEGTTRAPSTIASGRCWRIPIWSACADSKQ